MMMAPKPLYCYPRQDAVKLLGLEPGKTYFSKWFRVIPEYSWIPFEALLELE